LAAHLYKKNGRWEESISLSKQDKLYKDAMITAAVSASTEVAEELLSYFVDIGNKECFAALLYICFDLLRSDVVEELSWQHGLNDFYMPYKIQVQRSLVEKVSTISISISKFHISFYCSWRNSKRRSRNGRRRTPKRNRPNQKLQ
jgi:clathrin heavy chain